MYQLAGHDNAKTDGNTKDEQAIAVLFKKWSGVEVVNLSNSEMQKLSSAPFSGTLNVYNSGSVERKIIALRMFEFEMGSRRALNRLLQITCKSIGARRRSREEIEQTSR